MFAQRLAGHSAARIARALNEAGVPCPSAADPARNRHRTAAGWTLGTVATILSNPRYTGHQVWNRQRTDTELADPGNVTLGHKSVQPWNLPDGWVISARAAHPALVTEADFIAAQDVNAARGPAAQDRVRVMADHAAYTAQDPATVAYLGPMAASGPAPRSGAAGRPSTIRWE
jgi:site-specific DNA recombinase